jgi:hypothetical protein
MSCGATPAPIPDAALCASVVAIATAASWPASIAAVCCRTVFPTASGAPAGWIAFRAIVRAAFCCSEPVPNGFDFASSGCAGAQDVGRSV